MVVVVVLRRARRRRRRRDDSDDGGVAGALGIMADKGLCVWEGRVKVVYGGR